MARSTFHAAYAKHVLSKHLLKKYNTLHGRNETKLPSPDRHKLLGDEKVTPDYNQAICIVGAGPAGLSAAMMLNSIGFTNITILEASSRVGGRAYTYHFTMDRNCPHNYYDAGAMRIPLIDTQLSTMNMIDYLNNQGQNVPTAKYTYSAGTEPSWYEYATDDTGFNDYMTALLTKHGFLTPPSNLGGPSVSTLDPKSFDDAFWNFISSTEHPDRWSTRDWLMMAPSPDGPQWLYPQTQKAETFDTSTGLFDQAFMETICDWYDFTDAQINDVDWWRIEGGMSVLTDALAADATKNGATIVTGCPVMAMKDNGHSITVTYAGNPQTAPPTEYAAVFNTTTFGCLQRMDIQGLGLSPDNLCGIRALSYDRATKVAIKFNTPWWRDLVPEGGSSSTDLCIRSVVYPSWDDGPDSAYTIIVSYSWAQDATRMASLISANDVESTDPADPIIQLCLRDLVTLWSKTDYPQTVNGLLGHYSAHHVFSWSHNPYTSGAFALFGPGQFEYLYPQFTLPLCNNKLSICGEAVSAHHAWISGAFDSAYNAVYTWCTANNYVGPATKLQDSPFGGGSGEHTAELDEKLLQWHLGLAKQERKAKK